MKPNNKTHVLLFFNDNWADEMDLDGFKVMTADEYKKWQKDIKKVKTPIEVGFGTNESSEYENYQDLKDAFTATKITASDAEVIKRVFKKHTYRDEFGHFPDIYDLIEDDE